MKGPAILSPSMFLAVSEPFLNPQWIVIATLLMSLTLFVTDAMRYDAVAILVVLVLAATDCLTPTEAFAGFSSKAVVLVASMYIFAAAVSRAGITEILCQRLISGKQGSETWLVFRVVVTAALLSSVLSNAAVVAAMIPVLGAVSRRTDVPVSRLLIPLSFASLLGGMLTLIGTSKNIAANEAIVKAGSEPFGLFDFTAYGFVLLAGGILYFLGPGRLLLPRRRTKTSLTEHYQVPKFVTEVMVEPTSSLIHRTVSEIDIFEKHGITILGIIRPEGEDAILAPGPYNRIRSEDVLMLQGEPAALLKLREELGFVEHATVEVGDTRLQSTDVQLVEVVVPATSNFVGLTLAQADFREQTGLNVLAIAKHGDTPPTKLKETRLVVGDTLLVQGHTRDIERMRDSRELIVMGELRRTGFGREAFITIGLLALVLILGTLSTEKIPIAALGGALGLVLFRCVRPSEAQKAVDWSVLILIGGMLALGNAFNKHGLSGSIANWILDTGGAISDPRILLAIILVTTVLLTQVINHVAAAVIMAPVAVELASQLGLSDRAFLMAVLTGAEFAFMSPVAHQANAMVMGPGDYRYRDFLKVGTPITILLVILAAFTLPLFWPF